MSMCICTHITRFSVRAMLLLIDCKDHIVLSNSLASLNNKESTKTKVRSNDRGPNLVHSLVIPRMVKMVLLLTMVM